MKNNGHNDIVEINKNIRSIENQISDTNCRSLYLSCLSSALVSQHTFQYS